MGIDSIEKSDEIPDSRSTSEQLRELYDMIAHRECEDKPNQSINLEGWQERRLEMLGGKAPAISDPVYATDRNFTGAPLPGYESKKIWLHPSVAEQLVTQAYASLKKELTSLFGAEEAENFVFIVKDGYRPHRASDYMVEWAKKNDSSLVGGAVASGISNHNKEYTVDLTLGYRGPDGVVQEVWMGGPFDDFEDFPKFSKHGTEARTHDNGTYDHLSYGEIGYKTLSMASTLQLRDALKRGMTNAGFSSYSEEWWHYTSKNRPSDAACYDRPIY